MQRIAKLGRLSDRAVAPARAPGPGAPGARRGNRPRLVGLLAGHQGDSGLCLWGADHPLGRLPATPLRWPWQSAGPAADGCWPIAFTRPRCQVQTKLAVCPGPKPPPRRLSLCCMWRPSAPMHNLLSLANSESPQLHLRGASYARRRQAGTFQSRQRRQPSKACGHCSGGWPNGCSQVRRRGPLVV